MKVAAIQNISSFSLLESPTKVKDLLVTAKQLGYEAVGLTDINVTYGLVNFFELSKEVGIKPLLGMQVRVNGLVDSTNQYDLIVLAKNNAGYHNILRLSSAINLLTENGEKQKVLTLDELTKYLGDLVMITSANSHSELLALQEQNEELCNDFIRKLKELLPSSSSFYLGVYASKQQQNYLDYIQALAKQFDLPLVAVEDTQYLKPQEQFLRRTLLAIKAGTKLEDTIELAKQKGSHFLNSATEVNERYHNLGLDSAVTNTWKIAAECNAEVVFQAPVLPKYRQDEFPSSKEYLTYLTNKGLTERFAGRAVPEKYQKQLDYELGVIDQMGFDDYFLIVWDVINYCHRVGITTGPGRGSACGSLVSYALRITEVDPLKYHLLFERFLNPARHEMPDIDLDIPDNRRDDVIKYMYQKYGMDHAAQILTFGTLAAKQALRDTGRVFGLPVVELNKWANAVPFSKTKISLNDAYKDSREMRILVGASEQNKLLFQTARGLEGLPRHYSIHAAGLVISDNSIAEISGLQSGQLGIPVTQQTKKYVEALGLLKIDFLGLRNLTILGDTLTAIRKQGINIDPNKIPLDDPKTLALFQAGDTEAVFQFESAGIRRVLKSLHPDNFEDLVAVNALYRPGPMQNIDSFVARKRGKEPVTYPDPSLKTILAPTYGILVYQEQVMQTAQVLAGFSLGEADILRRAMSKKKQDVIDQERDKFIAGTVKKGHPRAVGERVYNYIEQFANYGFNRSHAVAYTEIAFWLAYLKVHFPAEFYTAMLNSTGSNKVKAQGYIMRAQAANVRILAPDINKSAYDFTVNNKKILVGLRAIKGLRNDFLHEIVALKKPIKSLLDFLRKINPKYLQTDAIKLLIMAGCFDQIDNNRNKLLLNCQDLVENVKLTGQNISLSESLGGVPIKEAEAPTPSAKAEMEEQVLGFATTANPLIAVQKYAKKFAAKPLNQFEIGDSGISVGKLMSLKLVRTKKGTTMAFTSFADSTSKEEIVIFPAVYDKVHSFLKEGNIYLIGLKAGSDRFDNSKKQYIMTNLREVNFKNKEG
ncbi:DNA polymerase III subunit alpha [Lactobacillus sp. ESL0791]|uniref:DNA polymerase III subunit alpha n=1 Tax=Lactobacillus sp. ESL0791 TaxID=2983234 RepID=UPI0023F88C93|nr:DNA polymerase III subunit alpha [Lactobacillus sp. ESL0791]MDF7638862.1 DNA polymerase III subunit alpha [Lactobacillus sp. ESL0791]